MLQEKRLFQTLRRLLKKLLLKTVRCLKGLLLALRVLNRSVSKQMLLLVLFQQMLQSVQKKVLLPKLHSRML